MENQTSNRQGTTNSCIKREKQTVVHRGGQTFNAGDGGGEEEVDGEEDMSKARKLSAD